MRVYLDSLGCRLNAAEIETLARQFAGVGCEIAGSAVGADLLVLNTCAVTAQAARKSRQRIRALYRDNPAAPIAVLGCWATADPDRVVDLPGVRWVLPNPDKARAVESILGQVAEAEPWEPGRWGHTRAFLAVQEGCDSACTYCITRLLRGRARSAALDEVVRTVAGLVAQGAREVVLTGVSLGAYGRDLGLVEGLATLVEALLEKTSVPRLRLSSIEPWDVGPALLRQWQNPRLCRQLHIPLQSGSERILRRMGRPITPEAFIRVVEQARAVSPALAITTDVLVGFPGEGEREFEETFALVEALEFARLHVFPYSERAGTAAVRLPDRVSSKLRRERSRCMRALGARLATAYRARFLGEVLSVLWERRNARGCWQGLTDNYIPVLVESPQDLFNRIMPVRLLRQERGRVRVEIPPSREPLEKKERP
ncbi:MAG: tRNA (N(6)-L-threonylcarbamoyladenosine(37)-C(2))-methylthiotransferase MtaB [Anaerolineales bacterium]